MTEGILSNRSGVHQPAEITINVMGYKVVARGGWVVEIYASSQEEWIVPVPKVNISGGLLD